VRERLCRIECRNTHNEGVDMKRAIVLFFLAAGIMVSPAPKSAAQESPRKTGAPATPAPELKGRVYQLAHRPPSALLQVLQPLTSGRPGAVITGSDELRTISVRDFPENLEAIEAAIRLLDKPETVLHRTALEAQISVIAASQDPAESEATVPSFLTPVVDQLRRTLSFRHYRYVTTLTQRILDHSRAGASGAMPNPFPVKGVEDKPGEYQYEIRDLRVVVPAGGPATFQIGDFEFTAVHFMPVNLREVNVGVQAPRLEPQKISLTSGLSVREGEQLVVGSSYAGAGDKAVIIVLSIRRP
jgi:hypothetical protein